MWNMKKCPRCGGDIYMDEDMDRCYEKCLQCGFEREMAVASGVKIEKKPSSKHVHRISKH